jgi:hypothetical protein
MRTPWLARKLYMAALCAGLILYSSMGLAQEVFIAAEVDGSFNQHEYYTGTTVTNGTAYIHDTYGFDLRSPGAEMDYLHSFGMGAMTQINGKATIGYITGRETASTTQINLDNPDCCAVGAGVKFTATEITGMKTSAAPAGTGDCCGVNYTAEAGLLKGYLMAGYVDRRIGQGILTETDSEGTVTGETSVFGNTALISRTRFHGNIKKFQFGVHTPCTPEGEIPNDPLLDPFALCAPSSETPGGLLPWVPRF